MTAGHNEDPISAASSGLRAIGVPGKRRTETLGLLSALLDLSDERGEVPLDASLMETEERLGFDACLEGYEWLEQLDVIRRTWSGWLIVNYEAHQGPAGMAEASMAVLQKHFDSIERHSPEPVPTEEPSISEQAQVVVLRSWRRRAPLIGAGIAAGIAALTGATTLMPQAASNGRTASDTNVTQVSIPRIVETTTAPDAPASTDTADGDTASTVASEPAVTTTSTTSTTLLPGLPCLTDAVNDLTSRTGILGRKTTVLPPEGLACP